MAFRDRLSHAWNAFLGRDPTAEIYNYQQMGTSSYYPSDKPRLTMGNDRSIVNSIYNRIAIDVSLNKIRHVNTDENGKYVKYIYHSHNT